MADDKSPKPDKYEIQLTQAVDYLRGNVKWSLVAFGAIGTTLLAGSQLSNLGRFQIDEPRLWAAVLFAVLALGAASYAVRTAQAVAYTGHVEYSQLTQSDYDFIENNRPILEGFDSVAALRETYQRIIAQRYRALMTPGTPATVLESNEHWYAYLDSMNDKILAYIRYNRIRLQVDRSRTELTAASIVAAIGLVGFAWAANPAKDNPTILLKSPASEAALTLTEAGRTTLAPVLGKACTAQSHIEVIVLNVTATSTEVLSLKTKDCPLVRFTMNDALGKLAAASP